jgi:hypothetical protein
VHGVKDQSKLKSKGEPKEKKERKGNISDKAGPNTLGMPLAWSRHHENFTVVHFLSNI